MKKVTASEFQNKFGTYKEQAQREPIMVTSNGRESVVLISMEEFEAFQEYRRNSGQSDAAFGGEVTKSFEEDVKGFMSAHSKVLEGLAK